MAPRDSKPGWSWARALALAAATLVAIVIVAAVALAALVTLRLSMFSHRWPDAPYPTTVRLDALAGRPATGDLILFAASAPSITNLVFSLEYFSHAALVVDLGACIHDAVADGFGGGAACEYACEGGPRPCDPLARLTLAESYLEGTRLVPLRARLTQDPGAVYFSRRAVPLAPAAEAALLRAATVAAPYPTPGNLAAGILGIGAAASAKAVAASIGTAAKNVVGRLRGGAAHHPAHQVAPTHCMFFVAALLEAAGAAPPELVASNYVSSATAVAELPRANGDYIPFVRVLP